MKLLQNLFSGRLSSLIFWGYNLVYLTFVILVLLSTFVTNQDLVQLLTFGGSLPFSVIAMIYGFAFTPFISMALALFTRIRESQTHLIKLFFGFEIPLMALMLIRIVMLRQVTPAIWVIFLGIVLSVVGLLVHLYHPHIKSKIKLTLLMLSQQIALIIAGYAFLLIIFFLPIIVAFIFRLVPTINIGRFIDNLVDNLTYGGGVVFLMSISFMVLGLMTAGLFAISPIAAFILFWNNCKNLYHRLIDGYGLNFSRLTRYGVSLLFILIVIMLSIQNNVNSYSNLITSYKNAQTFEDRQKVAEKILQRDNELRDGFTSSYLAQYRYLSDDHMNLLQQGYQNELQTSETTAQFIQKLFNNLATPFIYQGSFDEDIKQSAENYRELFDNSIQKGELNAISNALKATNTQDSLKAGILDLNQKTVQLVSRTTQVTPQNDGLLATVTIEEEYQNTSQDQQEVYYEFSLPDNAVITELKLGPDLDIPANAVDKALPTSTQAPQSSVSQNTPAPTPVGKVDNAIVAPEQAATNTYDNQIARRTDPALLSQVGPRQYKLRIFPIPVEGQTIDRLRALVPQKNQRMRFSYVTLNSSEGVALPIIGEQRNIFTNQNTKFMTSFSGQAVAQDKAATVIKSPQTFPCPTQILESPTMLGEVSFVPHSSNPILSSYYSCQEGFSKADRTVKGLHIALLLDSSYSNQQKNWNQYLKDNFPIASLVQNNNVDLYYFNDKVSQKIALTESVLNSSLNKFNIGKTDRAGALASIPAQYNLILMVTDENVFDVKPEGKSINTTAPIYIIEPKNLVPPYNDLLTNAVIQSNGKIVTTGFEAINHYWQQSILNNSNLSGTVIDTNELGTWVLASNNNTQTLFPGAPRQNMDKNSPFSQLVQKRIVIESMRQAGQSLTNIDFLDRMNQLSQNSFIVTPYSSMIVLVTEQQKSQLAKPANKIIAIR